MANTMKKTANYLNPTDFFYNTFKDNAYFKQEDWNTFANRGELDNYIGVMAKFDQLPAYEKLDKKWHIGRADSDLRYAMLSTELGADRTTLKDYEIEEPVIVNPNGTIPETVTTAEGAVVPNKIKKTVQMTEYDYLSKQFEEWVKYDTEVQAQELKDKGNWALKTFNTVIGAPVTWFMQGVGDTVDNLSGLVGYIGNSAIDILSTGKVNQKLSDYLTGGNHIDEVAEKAAWYSFYTDQNGELNKAGQIVNGLANSFGQASIMMMANIALPGLGTSVKAASVLGQGGYYTAMFGGRVGDRLKSAEFDKVSEWKIVTEAAVQTMLDYAITLGMNKFLGASFMDKVYRGVAPKAVNGGVVGRFAHDFLSEGLEEGLQEYGSYLVSEIMAMNDKEFHNADFSFQTVLDAFLLGGLSSVLMNIGGIIMTDRVPFGENQKFSKLKSWVYNANSASLVEAYGTIINNDKLSTDARAKAMSAMYNSFTILSQSYKALGAERVQKANELINKMYNKVLGEPDFVTESELGLAIKTAYAREYAENVMNEIKQLGLELEGKRLNDIIANDDEVQEEIADAGITKISELIRRSDFPDVKNSKKLTKLADDLGVDNVAYTDGSKPIVIGDTLFVNPDVLNNYTDISIVKSIATKTIIKNIRARLNKDMLKKLFNIYKSCLQNKRNANYDQMLEHLMFDETFFRVCLASADQDMFNFLSMFDNLVEHAAGKTNLEQLMYQQVVKEVSKSMRIPVIEYLINQQNANVDDLKVLNNAEKDYVNKMRYSKDLANRILDDEEFKKLTDEDWKVLNDRINYLKVDKLVKEQIRKMLHSESANARAMGLATLDNEYRNRFFSVYNDQIFLKQVSPGNNWFNEFMRAYGFNLTAFLSMRFSEDIRKLALSEYGMVTDDTLTDTIRAQFQLWTKYNYDVVIENGKISVIPLSKNNRIETYTQDATEYVSRVQEFTRDAREFESGSYLIPSRDYKFMRDFTEFLVDGSKYSDLDASTLRINQILQEPKRYLKQSIQKAIAADYGKVDSYTAFMYIRSLLLQDYETITLSQLSTGEYVYTDLVDAYGQLLDGIRDAEKGSNTIWETAWEKGKDETVDVVERRELPISYFIDKNRLTGPLADIKVYLVKGAKKAGGYNRQTNTITINVTKTNAFFKFVLLHEFQHAIQFANKMNGGFTIDTEITDAIIADFEKNAPDVFKRGDGSMMTERKDKVRRIQWYLYETSGEHVANLQGDMIAFVPTLIEANNGRSAKIVTPWGTRHMVFFKNSAYENIELPTYNNFDQMTEILSPKEYPEYYALYESGNNEATPEQKLELARLIKELNKITAEYWSQEYGGEFISQDVKKRLVEQITPEVREKMLRVMWLTIAPGTTYENFLTMTIPYARIQRTSGVYKDVFVSASAGDLGIGMLQLNTDSSQIAGTLYVGTLKPTEIIGFIDTEHEVLLDTKTVKKAKEVKVARQNGEMVYVPDSEYTIPGDEVYATRYIEFVDDATDAYTDESTFKYHGFEKMTWSDLHNDDLVAISPDGTLYINTDESYISDFTRSAKSRNTGKYYSFANRVPFVQYAQGSLYIKIPQRLTRAQYNQIVKIINEHPDLSITVSANDFNYRHSADLNNIRDGMKTGEVLVDTLIDLYNNDVNKFISQRMMSEEFAHSEDDTMSAQPAERAFKQRRNKQGAAKRPDSERTYVNKSMAGDTNLKHYVGRYIARDMQEFIKEASPTRTEPELYELIVKGEISYYDIDRFFRSHAEMNEYTFNLINKYFFKNDLLNTKAKLEKFIALDIRYYFALNTLLTQAGLESEATKPMSLEAFTVLYERAMGDEKLKKQLDKLVEHAFDKKVYNKDYKKNGEQKFTYEALDIDENHLRTLAMRLMHGSIDNAAQVIATARAIAMSYQYGQTWNTADVKKETSLDESTKNTKSGEDAGTRLDVVADERSSRDFFDQAYDERVANDPNSVKHDVLIDYYGKKYRAAHPDWKTYSEKKRYQVAKSIQDKVLNFTQEELDNRYKKILAKQDGAKMSDAAIDNDKVMPVKNVRKNLITRIKSLGSTISNWLSTAQWKNLPDRYKQYFDEKTKKLKPEYYVEVEVGQKDFPKLEALRDDLRFVSEGLCRGSFATKKGADLEERLRVAKEKLNKQKQKTAKAELKLSQTGDKVTVVNTRVRDFTMQSNQDVPSKLSTLLETTFDNYRKSTVKFLAGDDDYQMRLNSNNFYKVNADVLSSLTTDEVIEIINFYENAMLMNASDQQLRNFNSFEILLLGYFIEGARNGSYPGLDSYYIERAEDILKTKVSIAATELALWRQTIKKVDPTKVVIQAMAGKYGVELDENDVKDLSKAVATGELRTIQNAQRRMYNNALEKYKGTKVSLFDKILKFQKAMMLSNPATAVRNQVSNAMLYKGNQLADFLGNLVTKKSTRMEQFNLTGVKVSDRVANFVKTEFIDSGFFDLIGDGLSKYDNRKTQTNIGVDLIVDMIATGVATNISYNNTYNKAWLNTIINTVFKFQTDDVWIKKTAIRYIGKMLEQQKVNINNGKTSQVLEIVAEGYTRAAMDYMHRSNVFNALETKFREKAPKAYFGYKLLFPFMPSAWNWFVESLNWTPLGLAKNIVSLMKVEKTIADLENRRMKGEPVMSPRFAEAMAKRGIGKGIIGSFVMGLGMLLAGLGVVSVDDKDDKLKLKFDDVYIDIANVFGTSSFIVGAEMMNPRKGNAWDVMEATFTALIEDSWFNDIANMFSYGADSVWDVLLDKTNNLLTSFIPNFVKSFSKLLYDFDIKYDSGVLGNLQYFVAQIPGVAYALPKKIDPYTGEVQSTYGLPFFADFAIDALNQWLPFKIQPRVYSEQEKIAMSLGISRDALKGQYDDIGKVDYFALNTKYGELNKAELEAFINNRTRYDVENDKGVLQKNLSFKQMTEKQKKTVIQRIMSNNSRYAKVYAWTKDGHKYYTSATEYATLKKLGISTGVFKGDKGFVA